MRNSITIATVERNVIVDRGINADRLTVVAVRGEGMVRASGTPVRSLHSTHRYMAMDFTSKRDEQKQRYQQGNLQSGRLCLTLAPAASAAAWRGAALPAGSSARRRAALASQLARFRG